MTNLADIAAALREHSPGVLPKSFVNDSTRSWIVYPISPIPPCPDDIAAAVLIACMVTDGHLRRGNSCWCNHDMTTGDECNFEEDSDHGGSLGACYQAWRWSKGLPAA